MLKYEEKLTLLLYKAFFGDDYPVKADDIKQDLYTVVEQMWFLLELKGICPDYYNFAWDYEPFSPGLLADLHELRSKKDLAEERANSEDIEAPTEKAQAFSNMLQLSEHVTDRKEWLVLLGSIAYISNYVLPGENYDIVVKELTRRSKRFTNSTYTKKAWNVLGSASMLALYDPLAQQGEHSTLNRGVRSSSL